MTVPRLNLYSQARVVRTLRYMSELATTLPDGRPWIFLSDMMRHYQIEQALRLPTDLSSRQHYAAPQFNEDGSPRMKRDGTQSIKRQGDTNHFSRYMETARYGTPALRETHFILRSTFDGYQGVKSQVMWQGPAPDYFRHTQFCNQPRRRSRALTQFRDEFWWHVIELVRGPRTYATDRPVSGPRRYVSTTGRYESADEGIREDQASWDARVRRLDGERLAAALTMDLGVDREAIAGLLEDAAGCWPGGPLYDALTGSLGLSEPLSQLAHALRAARWHARCL